MFRRYRGRTRPPRRDGLRRADLPRHRAAADPTPTCAPTSSTVGTHLLVDEFQDLTPAFHLLVRLVASPSLQVFAVGDDDQVIYGYAGADPGYLIDYAPRFPGAVAHPLEVNYRCPPGGGRPGRPACCPTTAAASTRSIRAGRTEPAATTPATVEGRRGDPRRSTPGRWQRAPWRPSRTASTPGPHPSRHRRARPRQRHAAAGPGGARRGRDPPHRPAVAPTWSAGPGSAPRWRTCGSGWTRNGCAARTCSTRSTGRPARSSRPSRSCCGARGSRWTSSRQIEDTLSTTHADRWRGYLDDLQVLTDAITDGADTARVPVADPQPRRARRGDGHAGLGQVPARGVQPRRRPRRPGPARRPAPRPGDLPRVAGRVAAAAGRRRRRGAVDRPPGQGHGVGPRRGVRRQPRPDARTGWPRTRRRNAASSTSP